MIRGDNACRRIRLLHAVFNLFSSLRFFSVPAVFVLAVPSSRDCSLNGTMVLRDGEPWINRSACHLCACKQGVLLCRQLPRELTHYCLSQDWETMYSRGRPREMLLLSHKSCKVSQDQALSKVTRQIIDGSSIRLSCNWCKCSGGRLTCTNRNCNSRHDQRFETCPECIVTAANKLWSTSNTTSLPVCSKTMKTFQTRCHASRCGHFADESLKTGACGLVVSFFIIGNLRG